MNSIPDTGIQAEASERACAGPHRHVLLVTMCMRALSSETHQPQCTPRQAESVEPGEGFAGAVQGLHFIGLMPGGVM